jgi:hypothetical protein
VNDGRRTIASLGHEGGNIQEGPFLMEKHEQLVETAARSPDFADWPHGFGSAHPQRFFDNAHRYLARGGDVRPESDVKPFVAGRPDYKGDMTRFYTLCLAYEQLKKERVGGNLAELGVYRGNTAALLAIFARRLNSTLYLLDTFTGISSSDLVGIDSGCKVEFHDTTLSDVRALVGDGDEVQYVVGHFPDTIGQLPESSYCLVHLDCDLYLPITAALTYFYPRMSDGGFMIVHDYGSLHWPGVERAVDEFFQDKPESIVPIADSAGSVVIRKARKPSGQVGL